MRRLGRRAGGGRPRGRRGAGAELRGLARIGLALLLCVGCTVSRDIRPESFACRTGGACADAAAGARDGSALSDGGDVAFGDSGEPAPDSGLPPADSGEPAADSGEPPTDTGLPPTDGGPPPADSGEPPADSGEPPTDTGLPAADGGPPPADSGEPSTDTGVPRTDGGPPPADSGEPPADTGVPATDGGPPPADSGEPPADSGTPPRDTGIPPASDTGVPPGDSGVPPADTGVPPADTGVSDAGADAGVADAGACTAAAQCTGGTICWNGRCERPCSADGGITCTTGRCDMATGRCVDELPLNASCLADTDCTSTTCLSFRVGTTANQRCSMPCSASGNCPLEHACLDVSGMGYCIHESVFTNRNFDTPAGGFCATGNIACQSGWCSTGAMRCLESCTRAADCQNFNNNCYAFRLGANSYTNLCLTPTGTIAAGNRCAFDDQCRSGICDVANARCATHCCAESDCPTGEGCRVYPIDTTTPIKVCRPRGPSSGPALIGMPCTQPSDCQTEICVPANPSNPTGPRVCSTTCCRDPDCTPLAGSRCRATPGILPGTLLGACVP